MLTKAQIARIRPLAPALNVALSLSEAPSLASIELQEYQRPPEGDWRTWAFKAARNTGKTLTASAYCIQHLRELGRRARVGVMAPTDDDAITFCAEGETGLITLFRSEFPKWNRSTGEAWHYLGGYVRFMGSQKPRRWNGPQWSLRWIDEVPLCNPQAIREGDFGVRLGDRPREIWTMTPRGATPWLKQRLDQASVKVTRASMYQNKHASPAAVAELEALYKGTVLGRAFLNGEDVDVPEGAIWPQLGERREVYLKERPEGLRFVRKGAGLDWGMSRTHHAITLEGAITAEGVIWILRAYRGVEAGSGPMIRHLATAKAELGITFVAYDRSQSGLEDWIEDGRTDSEGEPVGAGLEAIMGTRKVEWRAGLVHTALGGALVQGEAFPTGRERLFFDIGGDGVAEAYEYLSQYHRDDDGSIHEEGDDDADALCYLVAEFDAPGSGLGAIAGQSISDHELDLRDRPINPREFAPVVNPRGPVNDRAGAVRAMPGRGRG